MNNFFEELQKIDWARNIAGLIVFILLCVAFFFLFLRPSITDQRLKNINFRKAEIVQKETKNEYEGLVKTLKELKTQNSKMINAFNAVVEKERLQSELAQYFGEVNIASFLKTPQEPYVKTEVVVQANSLELKNFYDFLDWVNSSGYIMRVDFPIDIRKEDEKLYYTFKLLVFSNAK